MTLLSDDFTDSARHQLLRGFASALPVALTPRFVTAGSSEQRPPCVAWLRRGEAVGPFVVAMSERWPRVQGATAVRCALGGGIDLDCRIRFVASRSSGKRGQDECREGAAAAANCVAAKAERAARHYAVASRRFHVRQ
jgi:hypothetical protein